MPFRNQQIGQNEVTPTEIDARYLLTYSYLNDVLMHKNHWKSLRLA